MEDGTALTLEEFATISAQIDAGIARDEALEQAGVGLEAWTHAQTVWLERMADQATRGRLALTERYSELFAKHRQQAGLKKYSERRLLDGPLPLPPASAAPPLIVMDRLVRASAPPLGPLPSQPRSWAPVPQETAPTTTLSVQEFAMLRAELAVSPEAQHSPTLARFSLDEAAWLREETAWHTRLTVDDRLREQYIAHFQYIRGLLGTR